MSELLDIARNAIAVCICHGDNDNPNVEIPISLVSELIAEVERLTKERDTWELRYRFATREENRQLIINQLVAEEAARDALREGESGE